jgi:hypothetical protein
MEVRTDYIMLFIITCGLKRSLLSLVYTSRATNRCPLASVETHRVLIWYHVLTRTANSGMLGCIARSNVLDVVKVIVESLKLLLLLLFFFFFFFFFFFILELVAGLLLLNVLLGFNDSLR